MKLLRTIRHGDEYPRGYGRAWSDYCTDRVVCAPLGLHLLIGAARLAYFTFRRGIRPAELDRLRDENAYLRRVAGDLTTQSHALRDRVELAEHRWRQEVKARIESDREINAWLKGMIEAHEAGQEESAA